MNNVSEDIRGVMDNVVANMWGQIHNKRQCRINEVTDLNVDLTRWSQGIEEEIRFIVLQNIKKG